MSNMLQDIMEQWDTENNFECCLNFYCNYLDREGKWNVSVPRAKNNFKFRLRKVKKEGMEQSREYKKFEMFIDKQRVREQKDVERRAIKLNIQWEQKCEEKEKEILSLKEEIGNLKQQLKESESKRMELIDKYDSE